jgi:hypothetical protein
MTQSLFDLGFHKGSIYETIITTFDSKNRPHAAPMGTTVTDARHLILRPFINTETFRNLIARGCGVLNVTSDPRMFHKTALKSEPWVGPPPKTWFESAKKIDAPRLSSSDSYVEFSVSSLSTDGPRGIARCKVVHTEFAERKVAPYCRGTFAAIESIVHATRVKELFKTRKPREARKLIELMKYYEELVDRVSPRSEEARIVHRILKHVGNLKKLHVN